MALSDEYPNTDYVLGQIFESAGDIKLALADGHLSVDEIVNAIPDSAVKDYLHKLLTALGGLPAEMRQVSSDPWKMMTSFAPALLSRVMAIFK
ncbi:MAG: hypothetical protein ACREOZ_02195 [Gloeomargaritales cyanobacterium]